MVRKKDLCILHIGMPKTGSSTIQDNLFQKVEDTRAVYTDLGVANQSGHLYGLFLKNVQNYHFFLQQNFTQQDIENFRHETKKKLEESFLDHSTSINIFSGEDLFHAQYDEIVLMKEYLEQFFEKILVIAYVRPVQSFSNSAFQQLVKYPQNGSFNYNLIVHRYKNIERYDKAYGKENVKVVSFLPKNFFEGDLLKDFCKHTGLKTQKANIEKSNESISKETISILFTSNYYKDLKIDFGYKNFQIHYRIVDLLRKIGNEKFQFSGKLIQDWVENYFKDDYAWLLQRIDCKDKDFFKIDTSAKGVSAEMELMEYATKNIDSLVSLVNPKLIDFKLEKNPQTVAKLVNALRIQIASEL